ncbi:hypothetical protein L228DRAFT_170792 [Xylona heveae TC161]|uniref:Uncharacterized protein n=1 Tax=Xylona heveae (strain CBS 132557 / TC161) TaxID=1328760 RepID=A0A165FT26_XYLHT|nr:hypothetical protein L228DRAFT_170792 [Xylona heveae TC161]KZF21339.1 hypothetical protein L228DRAFT_170792 [Xylona heveae TC161]
MEPLQHSQTPFGAVTMDSKHAMSRRFEDLFSAQVKPWLAEQSHLLIRNQEVSIHDENRPDKSLLQTDTVQSISNRFNELCENEIRTYLGTDNQESTLNSNGNSESPGLSVHSAEKQPEVSERTSSVHGQLTARHKKLNPETNEIRTQKSDRNLRTESTKSHTRRSIRRLDVGKHDQNTTTVELMSQARSSGPKNAINDQSMWASAKNTSSNGNQNAEIPSAEAGQEGSRTPVAGSAAVSVTPSSSPVPSQSSLAEPILPRTSALEVDSSNEDDTRQTPRRRGTGLRRAGVYRSRGRGSRGRRDFTALDSHESTTEEKPQGLNRKKSAPQTRLRAMSRGEHSPTTRRGPRTMVVRTSSRPNKTRSAPSLFSSAPKQVFINPPGSSWRWALHKPGRRPKELVMVFKF